MNIYIHIPFCRSRCAYCAFLSFADISSQDSYFKALLKEIESRKNDYTSVETIYFGGGTPSLVNSQYIKQVIDQVKTNAKFPDNIEITLEANPEDITEDKIKEWIEAGINRLSIGVQTLADDVRVTIGRRLKGKEVIEKVQLAQEHFQNVGVDFIAGLPGDELSLFLDGIKIINSLGIHHISLYDLELSPDSRFYKEKDKYNFLKEDEREGFLFESWELLQKLGFEQYEISNFAKNKAFCKHNLDFWNGDDYLGFGLGAVSLFKNTIKTNTSRLDAYLSNDFLESVESLSKNERKELDLALQLRLNIPVKMLGGYDELINDLINEGLMDDDLKVTSKGKLFNDYLTQKIFETI